MRTREISLKVAAEREQSYGTANFCYCGWGFVIPNLFKFVDFGEHIVFREHETKEQDFFLQEVTFPLG